MSEKFHYDTCLTWYVLSKSCSSRGEKWLGHFFYTLITLISLGAWKLVKQHIGQKIRSEALLIIRMCKSNQQQKLMYTKFHSNCNSQNSISTTRRHQLNPGELKRAYPYWVQHKCHSVSPLLKIASFVTKTISIIDSRKTKFWAKVCMYDVHCLERNSYELSSLLFYHSSL